MKVPKKEQKYSPPDLHVLPEPEQTEEEKWLESLETVLEFALKDQGPQKTARFLDGLTERLRARGVEVPRVVSTPYVNTIPAEKQAPFPGDWEMERRIKSYIRWNAMAMVVNANREHSGLGGHISTYASSATLYEVGFNHFFRGADGRFRRGHGLFPGARHAGHLRAGVPGGAAGRAAPAEFPPGTGRGRRAVLLSAPVPDAGVLAVPDGVDGAGAAAVDLPGAVQSLPAARAASSTARSRRSGRSSATARSDEPETLGSLTLASRENLDNLIWVVNCNLQRLDGPVRGNGKIIQELEAAFQGAGWNVIKVIWGSDWDQLLAADKTGLLLKRMEEAVDGDYQKYSVEPGSYTRQHFFGKYPELLELVNHLTDEQIHKLLRGGHDSRKVYAAYKAAVEHKGQPTVILAKTVKGYGLGEAGEGRNITHQQKKLNEKELREFRARFGIPISDEEIAETPFFRPPPDSRETKYLLGRRKKLGGFLPQRIVKAKPLEVPKLEAFGDLLKGSGAFRDVHHDGLCAAAEPAAPQQDHRPADRADHPGRGAHVRPGRAVPRDRHLFAQGPALRAGGQQVAALLPRDEGRADSRGRHHRGGLDGVVHRRGHVLRDARPPHDSVLHLLLDVRLPAHRRPDVAGGRHPGQGLPAGRHLGPHHAQRRRPAAPGRPQPAPVEHDPDAADLRPGVHLRAGGDHRRRHAPDVCRRARTSSIT